MRAIQNNLVLGAGIGFVCAAGAAMFVIPYLLWGHEHAPEFFGSFLAAIVAAVAVVLGAYYQAALTRKRDEQLRQQDQLADAVDLCHWLSHAATEMEFVADVLLGIGQHLSQERQTSLDWPLERYREVVSAQFMNELLGRAKTASRLPSNLAGPVSQVLYASFTVADRVYRLRGVPDQFRATADHIAKHEALARKMAGKLNACHEMLLTHITGS